MDWHVIPGIPALPLRLMEMVEKDHADSNKKIYVVANMGFFESKQPRYQNDILKWPAAHESIAIGAPNKACRTTGVKDGVRSQ